MTAPDRVRAVTLAFALALTLAVALASAGSAGAAGEDRLDRVLALLGAHTHRRARFTEIQHLAILDRPLISSGELIYDAPNRLEERVLKPRRESLVTTGDELVLARGSRRRTLPMSAVPQVAPLIASIRATLAGDRGALARHFDLAFTGTVDHWTLQLTPKSKSFARKIARIRLEGAKDALSSVEILETDGDSSTMTIVDEGP